MLTFGVFDSSTQESSGSRILPLRSLSHNEDLRHEDLRRWKWSIGFLAITVALGKDRELAKNPEG
jgi:hypothetical protein